MTFVAKEWKDRLVEYAGRRKLKNVATGEEVVYDVSRQEGNISQNGDAFSAENMNDLEHRVEEEFNAINSNLTDSGKITGYEVREGDGVYITYTDGADTVVKKLGEPELLYQTKGSNYPAFSNGFNWYTFNFPTKMIGIASIYVQGGDGRPDMMAENNSYDFSNQRVGIYWMGAKNPYRGYVSVTAVGY